jgi:hypothetical protein
MARTRRARARFALPTSRMRIPIARAAFSVVGLGDAVFVDLIHNLCR